MVHRQTPSRGVTIRVSDGVQPALTIDSPLADLAAPRPLHAAGWVGNHLGHRRTEKDAEHRARSTGQPTHRPRLRGNIGESRNPPAPDSRSESRGKTAGRSLRT